MVKIHFYLISVAHSGMNSFCCPHTCPSNMTETLFAKAEIGYEVRFFSPFHFALLLKERTSKAYLHLHFKCSTCQHSYL